MLRSVFGKTLWDQRRVLASWTIGVTAVGLLYAVFYPTINTPEMADVMESFPKGFLEAIGFTDISSAAGYVGSTTFGLLGPALIIIMGAALGGAAIAGEEESGRLDLTLAHPISRWSVTLQRFAALVAGMTVAATALWLGLVAISGLAQLGEIGVANLAAASLHLALLGTFFGALALAVGAATGRRALVYTVIAIVGVGTFLGNNLGPTIEGLGWLRDVSPFHYYSGGMPLRNGLQVVDAVVLFGTSLVLVFAGAWVFDRRDVAV
jgi:beta-exotoxin I transport system permease protein